MHPKSTTVCDVCGASAVLEVIPDGAGHTPATYTLTRTCSGACPVTNRALTPEEATALTGHAWDGAAGKWTRLASTSVEGWVP